MSKKGLFFGIIAILGGIFIIYFVQLKTTINEDYIELYKDYIDIDSTNIDSKNNGKIVATNGTMKPEPELLDSEYGIHITSVKLRRNVEMYQWIKKCKDGDCSYKKIWSNKLIDSTNYEAGYDNPDSIKYETKEFVADKVKIGNFELSREQIDRIDYDNKVEEDELVQQYISSGFEIKDNYFIESNDIENPDIGDIRISYDYVNPGKLSIMAIQKDNTFEPLKDKENKDIYILEKGKYNGKEIIDKITSSNNSLRLVLRIIGGLIIVIGIGSIVTYIRNKDLLERL